MPKTEKTSVELAVRKLRKKLRQIEKLEHVDRSLTDEELEKICKKEDIREELLSLLPELPSGEPHEHQDDDSSFDRSGGSQQQDHNVYEKYEHHDEYPTQHNEYPVHDEYPTQHDEYLAQDEYPTQHDEYPAQDEYPTQHDEYPAQETSHRQPDHGLSYNQSAGAVVTEEDINIKDPHFGDKAEEMKRGMTDENEGRPHFEQSGDSSPIKKKKEKEQSKPTGSIKAKPSGVTEDYRQLVKQWKKSLLEVVELNAHNDIVQCLDADHHHMVSGSRDTTIRVWDCETLDEVRSLGGHTGSVTCVMLLPDRESHIIAQGLDLEEEQIIVSGSQDCSLKLWSLKTGHVLKSVYTYNPVTCMTRMDRENEACYIVIGSGGGKIELWDVVSGSPQVSVRAEEDKITGVQVYGLKVYSSSASGVIRVHELRDNSLRLIFESENLKLTSGDEYFLRNIHCLTSYKDLMYFGDDGVNLKTLAWKDALVRKLGNHTCEAGATDAICIRDNLILTSSYDLDLGAGQINVRFLPNHHYVATLDDKNTSRILCLTCTTQTGSPIIFSGGVGLKAWVLSEAGGSVEEGFVKPSFYTRLDRPPRHSDIESEEELSAAEEDHEELEDVWDNSEENEKIDAEEDEEESRGWLSWCSVL